LLKGAARLTEYGDAAARAVVGVCEGGRRLLVKVRDWVIYWGRAVRRGISGAGGVVFDLPRSCVNNCTSLGAEDEGQRTVDMRREAAVRGDWGELAAAVAGYD
jgi:hypothetical protein